jgi:hypothetical protein
MAKTKSDSAPAPAKVFDVMRPGKAPASPSSKPVIVGHKPEVKDPSVTLNGIAEREPLKTHKKIEVTTGTRMPPIEVPNEPDAPLQPQITHDNIPEKEVEALATVALDNITESDLAKAPAAGPPQVQPGAPRTPVPPLPADALLETTAAPEVEAEGIVVSNHGAAHSSVGKTVVLVLVVVVLALAIFNVLLDAELLKLEAVPHTDFL